MEYIEYLKKAISGWNPIIATPLGIIGYILFPEPYFSTAFSLTLIIMVLDIITKYIAIASNNGGYKAARRNKKINSKAFFEGVKVKLIDYGVLAILAGVSYRLLPFNNLSLAFAGTIYVMFFLREFRSIVENRMDVGSDMGWLLKFIQDKEKDILNSDEDKEGSEDDDSN
jgi:hypothetical protein